MIASTSAEPLLAIERVSKSFGSGSAQFWAVRDISFALGQGECVALVGESGSGKSTLARMLVGLTPPSEGSITFAGESVAALAARRSTRRQLAARMQMVFQDPYSSLDPSMTIEAIIAEPLTILGWSRAERRERVAEVLAQVGLAGEMAARRPRDLSGGQRQRVGIARALASRPQLLLLDEPVASLDVSIQGQILRLLRDIQEKTGISMLIIAHDLGVVRAIADRTLVMYLGSLVEGGPTAEVFERPNHPYTLALLLSATSEGRRAMAAPIQAALACEPLPADERRHGCPFRPRCWQAVARCAEQVDAVEGRRGHWAQCNVPLRSSHELIEGAA
jgi:oligopeptide/dipeptide ABC transporter ATP-binding protein